MSPLAVSPFSVAASSAQLDLLKQKLSLTTWPDESVENDDWAYGIPTAVVKELAAYWAENYDWRKWEAELNKHPQFKAEVNGINLHFVHKPSSNPAATPLLLIHGWPGSFFEFHNLIDSLAEFHVVVPSLPGYGFSSAPTTRGFGISEMAKTLDELMVGLGYSKYIAQGGDWGSIVARALATNHSKSCRGIHINMVAMLPPSDEVLKEEIGSYSDEEKGWLGEAKWFADNETGYQRIQQSKVGCKRVSEWAPFKAQDRMSDPSWRSLGIEIPSSQFVFILLIPKDFATLDDFARVLLARPLRISQTANLLTNSRFFSASNSRPRPLRLAGRFTRVDCGKVPRLGGTLSPGESGRRVFDTTSLPSIRNRICAGKRICRRLFPRYLCAGRYLVPWLTSSSFSFHSINTPTTVPRLTRNYRFQGPPSHKRHDLLHHQQYHPLNPSLLRIHPCPRNALRSRHPHPLGRRSGCCRLPQRNLQGPQEMVRARVSGIVSLRGVYERWAFCGVGGAGGVDWGD